MTTMTILTGNTYPVKDALKAIGARWNADQKAWAISAAKADEARKIIAGGSTSNSTSASPKAYKPTTCRVCGQKQQTEGRYGQYISAGTKILKNGECVDCYEERKMGY